MAVEVGSLSVGESLCSVKRSGWHPKYEVASAGAAELRHNLDSLVSLSLTCQWLAHRDTARVGRYVQAHAAGGGNPPSLHLEFLGPPTARPAPAGSWHTYPIPQPMPRQRAGSAGGILSPFRKKVPAHEGPFKLHLLPHGHRCGRLVLRPVGGRRAARSPSTAARHPALPNPNPY